MSVKRKSTSISINDKLESIINIDKGESRKSVAKRLDVSVSTISGWFKNKDAIYKASLEFNNKRKRAKLSSHEVLEEKEFTWFKQIRAKNIPVSARVRTSMSASVVRTCTKDGPHLLATMSKCIPTLNSNMHKGQAGRIAIIGGCSQYTGAPYFAAISALKMGADLCHVFCEKSAGTVIKCYSPELIVHPILDTDCGVDEMIRVWLPKMHAVIIGPGLNPDNTYVLDIVEHIPDNIPIILDAGACCIVKAINTKNMILTPNAAEFNRLAEFKEPSDYNVTMSECKQLAEKYDVTVLSKGFNDIAVSKNGVYICECEGSLRRCGGQGDVLAGVLGILSSWALRAEASDWQLLSSYAASRVTRNAAVRAYEQCGRSTTTTDIIGHLHTAFTSLFLRE